MNEMAASWRPLYENTKKVGAPMAAVFKHACMRGAMHRRPPGSALWVYVSMYTCRVEGGERGSPDLLSIFVYSFHSYPQILSLCASLQSSLNSNVFL